MNAMNGIFFKKCINSHKSPRKESFLQEKRQKTTKCRLKKTGRNASVCLFGETVWRSQQKIKLTEKNAFEKDTPPSDDKPVEKIQGTFNRHAIGALVVECI
jgi:hypothetical protein